MTRPVPFQMPQAMEPAPASMMSAPMPHFEPAPIIRQEIEPARMPKIEDFPPVVKAEHDYRGQTHPQPEERGPMGLLKRLTNSLGRREEEETVSSDMTGSAPVAPSQQRRSLSPEASLYAPRRGNLDDQGRQVPQSRSSNEESELEIPAFLRRQSN